MRVKKLVVGVAGAAALYVVALCIVKLVARIKIKRASKKQGVNGGGSQTTTSTGSSLSSSSTTMSGVVQNGNGSYYEPGTTWPLRWGCGTRTYPSEEVKILQGKLNHNLTRNISVDGVWGNDTEASVAAFVKGYVSGGNYFKPLNATPRSTNSHYQISQEDYSDLTRILND